MSGKTHEPVLRSKGWRSRSTYIISWCVCVCAALKLINHLQLNHYSVRYHFPSPRPLHLPLNSPITFPPCHNNSWEVKIKSCKFTWYCLKPDPVNWQISGIMAVAPTVVSLIFNTRPLIQSNQCFLLQQLILSINWITFKQNKQELSSCWDGRPFGHNRHGPKLLWGLGPHLTQCGLGQGLPLYQVACWSIQPFGYNCRNATLLCVGIHLRTIFIPSLVVYLLSDKANCTVLRAVVLTQYRRGVWQTDR